MDEQDWYEKDLSDFDDPQLSDEEHEGNFHFFYSNKISFRFSSTTNRSIKTKTTDNTNISNRKSFPWQRLSS
jgi:hypothetical protein